MCEAPNAEKSSEGEITSGRSSVDDDVQLIETPIQVISITDDNAEQGEEASTSKQCPPMLATIQFNSSELYGALEQPLSAAIASVFRTHLPGKWVELRPGPDDRTLQIFETDTEPASSAESTNSLFVVDSTPSKNKKNDGPIPSYKKVMNKVYEGQTPEAVRSSLSKRPRARQSCWNCEGDHGLKDCKEPRNYTRIRQKKEEFQKKTERYHADMEQKYGHFVPGLLSRELRDALGLCSRDLPLHIYQMRKYGYPPGWLEDAKVTHSGLQLFDSNGDVVQHSDQSDGEDENARSKYDVRKIIAFPGFNESPAGKMFDDCKFYNVPPYSEELSRERMIRRLEGTLVHGYRRKKLKLSVDESGAGNSLDASANMDLIDMDGVETSPQSPLEPPPPPASRELEDGELLEETESGEKLGKGCSDESVILIEAPIEVITLDDTVMSEARPASPSLDDLEKAQQELVEQLASQSVDRTGDISGLTDLTMDQSMLPPPPPSLSESLPLPPADAGAPEPPPSPPPTLSCAPVDNGASPVKETSTPPPPPPPPGPPYDGMEENGDHGSTKPPEPETLNLDELVMNNVPYLDEPGSVGLKKMSLGTPILRAFTPYSALPSGMAFAKGVSDVINFENLPNSTGKYGQMKSLLLKVRQKISDHMRDADDDGR